MPQDDRDDLAKRLSGMADGAEQEHGEAAEHAEGDHVDFGSGFPAASSAAPPRAPTAPTAAPPGGRAGPPVPRDAASPPRQSPAPPPRPASPVPPARPPQGVGPRSSTDAAPPAEPPAAAPGSPVRPSVPQTPILPTSDLPISSESFLEIRDDREPQVDVEDDAVIVPAPSAEVLAHVPTRSGPVRPVLQPLSQSLGLKRTMIPILLTLGVVSFSLIILGLSASATSPYSIFRRSAIAWPLLGIGVVMLGFAIVTMLQVKHELGRSTDYAERSTAPPRR